MGYCEYPPNPALSGWVKCFWSIEDQPSEAEQEVWPDGCVELLFGLGNCFRVMEDGSSQPFPEFAVVGLQTSIMRVRCQGEVRLLGARLLPQGLGAWKLEELQQLSRQIEPYLRLSEFEVALELLEQWLLKQPKLEGSLALVLGELYAKGGDISVAELAAQQDRSLRQLERDFAEQLGITPKSLSKIVRFAEGWARLLEKPDLSLAELALELGYSDQAHFSREFKALGKQSPRSFNKQWDKG